jgi:surfactin synthase thioesterase subunit
VNPTTMVCFPPAGAGPSFFQGWLGGSALLDFALIDFPGKERLFAEPPRETVPALVEAIMPALKSAVGDASTVGLFGHCFGAIVAYEVAQRLLQEGFSGELVLFASGANPPGAEHTAGHRLAG